MALDNFRRIDMQINRANDYQLETQFAKEGDYNGRELVVQITNAGEVSDQTGVSLNLGWKHDDAGNSGLDNFTMVDAPRGIFKITYPTEMLIAGDVTATIQVIENGKITFTRNFKITVEYNPIDESAMVSENSFTALQSVLSKISKYDNKINNLENRIADVIQSTDLDPNKDQEIVDARLGSATLGAKISGIDDKIAELVGGTERVIYNSGVRPISSSEKLNYWIINAPTLMAGQEYIVEFKPNESFTQNVIQFGTAGSSSAMVDTVGENVNLLAGVPYIVRYTPTAENLGYVRILGNAMKIDEINVYVEEKGNGRIDAIGDDVTDIKKDFYSQLTSSQPVVVQLHQDTRIFPNFDTNNKILTFTNGFSAIYGKRRISVNSLVNFDFSSVLSNSFIAGAVLNVKNGSYRVIPLSSIATTMSDDEILIAVVTNKSNVTNSVLAVNLTCPHTINNLPSAEFNAKNNANAEEVTLTYTNGKLTSAYDGNEQITLNYESDGLTGYTTSFNGITKQTTLIFNDKLLTGINTEVV